MPIISLLLGNWKLLIMGSLLLLLGIQTWRVDLCQKGRHKDAVAAEAVRIQLEGSLQAQNEAIAKLGRESADRRAKAQDALKKAQEGVQKARSEAERLRALAKPENAPSEPTACPAGDAVQEIRRGLSK